MTATPTVGEFCMIIVKEDDAYVVSHGKGADCCHCGKEDVGEPNSFAYLNGGALLRKGEGRSYHMDEKLHGFINIGWHGAEADGKGELSGIAASIPLVEHQLDGQFQVWFCSFSCLRAFLNAIVDELEEAAKREMEKLD